MSEKTTPNDLAEHIATVLDGHHGGHLKAPLAAWTESHRDGVQIRVVLQRALSGGEDETFLLHAERLDTGGPHAIRDRWPFAPGQIVRDSGEGDDAAWLECAPVGTVVQNAEGCEWTRGARGWFGAHPSWATSADLAERGPLTVVSVPEPEHRYVSTGPVTGIRRCACGAAWTDVHEAQASTPTPTETTGAVERAAEAILEACYGQELPEAPIDLARAALAAVLPECAVAWDQGYTWGCNDSQNETETKNPYRATTTEGTTT